jgi:hypothetical protein
VDDLKISHVDPDVVTSVIGKLTEAFGKEAPLTVDRGRSHENLGMNLDLNEEDKVIIRMKS